MNSIPEGLRKLEILTLHLIGKIPGLRTLLRKQLRLKSFVCVSTLVVTFASFNIAFLLVFSIYQNIIEKQSREVSRSVSIQAFNTLFHLMDKGFTGKELEASISSIDGINKKIPYLIKLYKNNGHETDAQVIDVFRLGTVLNSKNGFYLTDIYPVKAKENCLKCHMHAKEGDILGAVSVQHDIGHDIAEIRRRFAFFYFLLSPVPFILAGLITTFLNSKINSSVQLFHSKIRDMGNIGDSIEKDIIDGTNLGFVEFNDWTIEIAEQQLLIKGMYEQEAELLKKLRRASHQNELILNTAGEGICGMNSEGKIMFANPAAAEICGYQVEELIGAQMHSLLHYARPDGSPYPREECPHYMTLRQGTSLQMSNEVFWKKDGTSFSVAFTSTPIREGDTIEGVVVTFRDITEIKQMEERERLARVVLERLTQVEGTEDAICDILQMIKQSTGFDAVGIRLRKGDDFPYFVQGGFSADFLSTENTLTVQGPDGGHCRDKDGKLSLECTCGLVISGRTDPANPLFTQHGSFWTNDSVPLLDLPADQDPRINPRNRCIHEGFHSFALIPLRVGKDIVGLLQLNDRRENQFTLEMVQFFEGLCSSIGIALARKWAEEEKAQLILESYAREMEVMKYRENYNITHQENAFKKELNIIRNDLFLKKIAVMNSRYVRCEWLFDIHYSPLDIMSGDTYSIREIEDGKVLVYLADAMGKGLSASVTSIISTSFVNHLINKTKEGSGFDFREFISAYSKIVRSELIEEEILCVTLIFLDLVSETMDTVICAMPPLICHTADNTIVRIKSNNLPLMMYPAELRIDRYCISDFNKILAHTDGLNESLKTVNSLYQDCLENDFRQSEFKSEFLDKFGKAVKKPDDDVTFLFLRRIDFKPKWTKGFTIASRMEELLAVTVELEEFLETLDVAAEFKVMFIDAFTEILMNAYEHGSLNIDIEHKSNLMTDEMYDDYLANAERNVTKRIMITLGLQELNGREYLMLTVADEGKGFDTSLLRKLESNSSSLNGRGIKMTKGSTNELFYNRVGNEATLLKEIVRG